MKRLTLVVILCMAAILIYVIIVPASVEELDMQIEVANYFGIKTDNDAVYFGAVTPGSTGKRDITIVHDLILPKRVVLAPQGELAEWVTFSEDSFWLGSDVPKVVTLYAHTPSTAENGNYSGLIKIKFRNL
jgi:hypothetical protein